MRKRGVAADVAHKRPIKPTRIAHTRPVITVVIGRLAGKAVRATRSVARCNDPDATMPALAAAARNTNVAVLAKQSNASNSHDSSIPSRFLCYATLGILRRGARIRPLRK